MASGNSIWTLDPRSGVAPATLYALRKTIADLSTPAAAIPILRFDPTTAWYMYWFELVPSQYDGGGFTWRWKGGTDNASVGTLILDLRILKVADATDLSSDLGIDLQTASPITDTPPATPADKLNYSGNGTLSHANAGSPSEGDYMAIAIKRDVADTNTGFLQLAKIDIKET